jgi:hypothetical protein
MAVVAAAVFCLALLTGCTSAPSDAQVSHTLGAAIAKPLQHASSVTVGMGYDGSTRRTFSVRIYLNASDDSVVTSSVDSALKTVWRTSPVLPSSVTVSVVEGQKPVDGSKGVGIDLSSTATTLGVPVPEVGRDLLLVRAAELQRLYGARPTH